MDVIKITLVKYISQTQIDFISNNDIKIQLSYNGYTIEFECIKNVNNPLINKDFIFHYVKDIPLIINIYDTHNILGDVLLQQIVKRDLVKEVEYINNSNLKYYYEIVSNNDLLLYKYFQQFKLLKLSKVMCRLMMI